MVRTPSCDKNGLKKGTWTPEEDRKLIAYVTRYGCWNWRQLPRFAGLARCGKSCRLRWLNYLRPNIKRGNYTQEEEEIIIRLHEKMGNRWSAIAAHLPGRTDNEIKNHWHTTLKKRFLKNCAANGKAKVTKSNDSSPVNESKPDNSDAGPLSPQSSSNSSEFSSTTTGSSVASGDGLALKDDFAFLDAYAEPLNENMWTEPNMCDISNVPSETVPNSDTPSTVQMPDAYAMSALQLSSQNLVMGDQFAFLDADSEPVNENFWIDPTVADMSLLASQPLTSLVTDADDYLFPFYDSELWCQSNLYDECISLF